MTGLKNSKEKSLSKAFNNLYFIIYRVLVIQKGYIGCYLGLYVSLLEDVLGTVEVV